MRKIFHLEIKRLLLNMKNPFKKATVRKSPTVAPTENYFFQVPTQALKSWRYFDNFNVNHYIKVLNQRSDNLIELQ